MILAKRRKGRNGAHEQEFHEFEYYARPPALRERTCGRERWSVPRTDRDASFSAPVAGASTAPLAGAAPSGYCGAYRAAHGAGDRVA